MRPVHIAGRRSTAGSGVAEVVASDGDELAKSTSNVATSNA